MSKSSYILNDLTNFNEIFRENVTYNIKSHKKSGLYLFFKKDSSGKTNGYLLSYLVLFNLDNVRKYLNKPQPNYGFKKILLKQSRMFLMKIAVSLNMDYLYTWTRHSF